MAQKKAHEVDQFIKRFQREIPIVLIYGPDRGLVSERARLFAEKTGINIDDPFATIRMDASEIDSDPTRLLDEANTISLFGGDRLIWIRNASAQKGLANAVKDLVKTPPQNCFVLVEAGDLKKNAALRSTIETATSAMALPCYADDQRDIDQLIDSTLDQFNLSITLDARKWLRMSLGGDRLSTRGELEKLCLYAMGKGNITTEDVIESVSNVSSISQDAIIDAVLIGDLKNFNADFDRQLGSGTPLFLVLSAALRQFQQLHLLRAMVEIDQKPLHAAVASARPPIFFKRQKLIEKALMHWTLQRIENAMVRLQRTVLESRQTASLDIDIVRQALLALTVESARFSNR